MRISKFAQSVNMSLDVPTAEKKIAAKCVRKFQHLSKNFDAFDRHLDILYNPFKSHEDVSEESVLENRSALRRYRDKIKENFEDIKIFIVSCVKDFNNFSYDSQVSELIKSFDDSVGSLGDAIDELLISLDNWQDKEYRTNVMKNMDNVRKFTSEIEKLINDRIIDHINTNILAKNWTDNLDDELKSSIKEKEPYIKQLHQEREQKLKQILESGE